MKLGILFFALDDSPATFYRLLQPAQKLDAQKLVTVGVLTPKDDSEDKRKAMELSDVLVFHQCAGPNMADQFDKLKRIGKKIVIDLNDDIFNLSPFSPHYKKLGTKEAVVFDQEGKAVKLWEDGVNIDLEKNKIGLEEQRQVLGAVDLITTTTSYLAKEVYSEFNRTAVLPDMVDCEVWKPLKVSYPENYFRLGWRGGFSHYEDLMNVKPAISNVVNKFSDVKLIMSGWAPNAFTYDMPKDRLETYPFFGSVAWPWHAMALGLNAAFYPWKNIAFNKGKNNLSWIEWSAAGVPGVYPALAPYSDDVKHGETGMLALSNEGFAENLSQLIKDRKLRRKIAWQAREEVEKNWDINKHITRWKEAYQSCQSTRSPDPKPASVDSLMAMN